jgi:hypothetical protein
MVPVMASTKVPASVLARASLTDLEKASRRVLGTVS